ncbi:MAG: GDYXXLXY domain-containing protein [Bacteroidales bacterium]|nr:GDYXXLXY domain-containing protein [Bacteroidales bacterium]
MRKKDIALKANMVLVLGLFVYSVVQKERILASSMEILMELAPRDPRSIMQGDYMRLNYRISNEISIDEYHKYVVVRVDTGNVAVFVRQQDDEAVGEGEILLRRTGESKRGEGFGADNYFFQEGTGRRFEAAKYGLLRVDEEGKCILVGLCDGEKKLIEAGGEIEHNEKSWEELGDTAIIIVPDGELQTDTVEVVDGERNDDL